jgi:hypothetical protein
MTLWCVTIRQIGAGSRLLNEFSFTVPGSNRAEAIENALKEVKHWNHIQTIHTDTQEYMKLQLRPYRKITWAGPNIRNIIVSAKQVLKK